MTWGGQPERCCRLPGVVVGTSVAIATGGTIRTTVIRPCGTSERGCQAPRSVTKSVVIRGFGPEAVAEGRGGALPRRVAYPRRGSAGGRHADRSRIPGQPGLGQFFRDHESEFERL